MWHPHPHISSGIDACGNCTVNISERVVQQHFVVTDVNAGGRHAGVSTVKRRNNSRPDAGAIYGAIDMPWAKLVGQIAQAYGK
jgi:hypothetical protein